MYQAPQKPVNAITPVFEGSGLTFLAGAADGRVYGYNEDQKNSILVEGKTHSNNVSGLATAKDGKIYSIGFDDHVREIDTDGSSFV